MTFFLIAVKGVYISVYCLNFYIYLNIYLNIYIFLFCYSYLLILQNLISQIYEEIICLKFTRIISASKMRKIK